MTNQELDQLFDLFLRAANLLRQRCGEEAIPLLMQLWIMWPEPIQPLTHRGRAVSPEDILSNLGLAYYQRWRKNGDAWDVASSIEEYESAIQVNPNCTPAMVGLGAVYDDLQDFRRAEYWYRRALDIDPQFAAAWNDLGMIRDRRSDLDGAKQCYERAIQNDPLHADAWNNLGEIYRTLKDYDRAVECYHKVLAANPGHRQAQENLQKVLEARGSVPPTPSSGKGTTPNATSTPPPKPRMESIVEGALDALRSGRLTFDQALALILTPEDKGLEVLPLVEALMQLGKEYPEQVIRAIGRVMSSQRLRQREVFVSAVFGAYLKDPARYFNALKELAQNDYEWVKFAVAESLLAGKLKWGVSVPGSTEAALEIALGLLDSRDRDVRQKVANDLWGWWIKELNPSALSETARSLYSQIEAKRRDV